MKSDGKKITDEILLKYESVLAFNDKYLHRLIYNSLYIIVIE